MHTDEGDYLSILAGLGKECLGTIQVLEDDARAEAPSYEPLSLDEVKALAREGAEKSTDMVVKSHLSLAGASGKVGLYWSDEQQQWYLPQGEAPSTHIVKQSHIRLSSIVTNEQLAMRTAAKLGIPVAASFIINTGAGKDEDILLAAKRYDRGYTNHPRTIDGQPVPNRLHQEDMAQELSLQGFSGAERIHDIITEHQKIHVV
ncbi:HipA-like N-terminal domain-containing protein [Lachnospiraceae bacterium NK3A20]|nr:HipA-like N-terminal domain-containing protein [Lachnospiraceae bacterium NK3A20]